MVDLAVCSEGLEVHVAKAKVLSGLLGVNGGLGGILSKFSLSNLELEDIMLVAFLIFYIEKAATLSSC